MNQTAADLRNAAMIVDTAGHTRGLALDTWTGSVCAMGALQLATSPYGVQTIIPASEPHQSRGYFVLKPIWSQHGEPSHGLARRTAAVKALAEQLPEPCQGCRRSFGHADPDSQTVADYDTVKVIHYNDHVCRGGDELVAFFIAAAEKLEADQPARCTTTD